MLINRNFVFALVSTADLDGVCQAPLHPALTSVTAEIHS